MSSETKIVKSLCNRCGHETSHHVRFNHAVSDSKDIHGGEYTVEWGSSYTFLECCGCADVSVRQRDWCSESDRGDYVETFFPPRVSRRKPSFFDDLHRDYKPLLEEIYSALHSDNRRLSLMGARAIIDIFITRTVGDHENFSDGMKALGDAGYIGAKHRSFIEAAIDAGHAAAHRGHEPSSKDTAAVMDIVENLIQQDTLTESAEALRQTTPARPPRPGKKKKEDA